MKQNNSDLLPLLLISVVLFILPPSLTQKCLADPCRNLTAKLETLLILPNLACQAMAEEGRAGQGGVPG